MKNKNPENNHGLFHMVKDFLKFEDMFAAGIQLRMHRKVKKDPNKKR